MAKPPATPLQRLVRWARGTRPRAAAEAPAPTVEELEPRLLYAADLNPALWASDGAIAPLVAPLHLPGAERGSPTTTTTTSAAAASASATQEQTPPRSAAQSQRHELIFVDAAVPDAERLLQALLDTRAAGAVVEVVHIAAGSDALATISDVLAQEQARGQALDAVHIVSHGAAGQLQLGGQRVDQHTLAQQAGRLQAWAGALTADADLLLWGCDVGQGSTGQAFTSELARLIGADVAASTDPTGNAAQGGNWALELRTGAVETAPLPDSAALPGFNSTLATYTVSNLNDSGAGSLRQAITDANANGGADSIAFSTFGTINLASALPSFTGPVSINGTNAGAPGIVLNGGGTISTGLQFDSGASNSTLRGLVVQNFSSYGVRVIGASGVTIAGNYIGTNSTGTAAAPNNVGIDVYDAPNTTIGGTVAADRNVVAGNSNIGINIVGSGAGNSGTVVRGNTIGANHLGSGALANSFHGIYVNGSTGVTIGGSASGAGNLISNSSIAGITLDTGASGNTIAGNTIGLNLAGNSAMANGTGMWILGSGNTVGGTSSAERNVLSGNTLSGIRISGASATGNTVLGNYIGTDAGGTVDLGNGTQGVQIDNGASNNTIGGTTGGARNIIAGNNSSGISIQSLSSTGNTVLGNWIGVGATGSSWVANSLHGIWIEGTGTLVGDGTVAGRNVIAGNTDTGIRLSNAANTVIRGNWSAYNGGDGIHVSGTSTGNVIGGDSALSANVFANNTYEGILVMGSTSNAVAILSNNIYGNGQRGIDLGDNGYDTNDGGDGDSGPNGLQNYPVLSSAAASTTGTTIAGSLNSTASANFRIDFYTNRPGDVDGTNGEGARWLGYTTVTTNGSGNATFNTTLTGVWINQGDRVTAVATRDLGSGSYGGSSEFSANITGSASGVVVVDTTSNTLDGTTTSITNLGNARGGDGRISLREAITAANNTANGAAADRIVFAIPPNIESLNIVTALQTPVISVSSALPAITQALNLDATTQPEYSSSPIVRLDASGAVTYGLQLNAGSSSSTVRGLSITGFSTAGINVSGSNTHTIAGNYLGLAPDGSTVDANGIGLVLSSSTGTTVGGTSSADRNVISGNSGVQLSLLNAVNSVVYGNYIGPDATGTLDVDGNSYSAGRSGVAIDGTSTGNQIGSTIAGARNVISGNNWVGVDVIGSGTANNTVAGNYTGTTATGLAALPNSVGISFWGTGSGNSALANVVSGNAYDGIGVGNGATGTTVQGNYVGLGPDGSTIVANGDEGIVVYSGSTGTLVGTNADGSNDTAETNVVSGNAYGIVIGDAGTTGTLVQGNLVGTDASGLLARGNTVDGVRIFNGATGNTVGGSTTSRRNIIAANGQDGVQIDGEASDNNTVRGNWIGVNAAGTATLGNGGDGIYVSGGADNTTIGGTGANDGNWVAGNAIVGIEVDGASTGTVIQGNRIGTNLAGTGNWGHGQNGILLENGASSSTVGAHTGTGGNIVAFSGQGGVFTVGIDVLGASSTGNAIFGNTVYGQTGLAIDLASNGVTANDAAPDTDTGPNNLQNFPVLATARTNASNQLVLTGTLTSANSSFYRIHFYGTASQHSSGYGPAETYLGFVDVATNGSGTATINTTLTANVPVGTFITATATRATDGTYSSFTDTSELARNIAAVSSTQPTVTVDTTNDTLDGDTSSLSTLIANKGADGLISLREAIIAANNTAGTDRIVLPAGTLNLTRTGASEESAATGDLDVTSAIDIVGAGSGQTTVSASALSDRIFDVKSGATLTLQALTLANASAGSFGGGAILNAGTLSATDVVMRNNAAISGSTGGAINNSGAVTLLRVSLYDNAADNMGGAIYQTSGSLSLTNVVISGNSAGNHGGGVFINSGTATVNHATIADNAAAFVGGGFRLSGGSATITNSILADNSGSPADAGGAITSGGYNIIEGYSGFTPAGTDITGAYNVLARTIDPTTGHAYYGFAPGDVAINAAGGSSPATDILGTTRDAYPDIGAFETTSPPQTYTVTHTLDNGSVGSLRWAITQANANAGALDTISFNIAGTGAHTIILLSALPAITDPVIIDASTDDSFAANSNRPAIVLDGNDGAFDGLVLASLSGGSTIRGLVIRDFGGDAIEIQAGSDGNTIVGNYLGRLTETGTAAATGEQNTGRGLQVLSSGNTLGGTSAADRNVIAGNTTEGIYLGSANNTVLGNYVGVLADGSTALGNGGYGIDVAPGVTGITLGGAAAGAGNVISGNGNAGVLFEPGSSGTVLGNKIGTNAAGNAVITGNGAAVHLATSNVTVGGTAGGEGNIIAGANTHGVIVGSGTGNTIIGNAIYGNSGLAIDLGDNGVTANDAAPDSDTGANNLQNFPVLAGAITNGSQITLNGRLASAANSWYRVEFFANSSGDASGYGEGQTYLGFVNVATDAAGSGAFAATFAVAVPAGQAISATATRATSNTYSTFTDTSEFAANVVATNPAAPVNTVPGAQTTAEDTARVFSAANGNAITVADSDAGGANNQVTLTVTNGTLTLATTAGLSFTAGDGTADATMTLRGTAAAINTALNGLSFAPSTNYNGGAVLTVTTQDSELLSLDIDSGLLGRYAFENSGNLGQDTSPAGTNSASTMNSPAAVVDGSRGNVIELNGNNGLQVAGVMGSPANVTLAAWVNLTAADTFGAEVISLGDRISLRIDQAGQIYGQHYNGSTYEGLAYTATLAGTGWRHVAFTFDDTNNTRTLYLDGVAVASQSSSDSVSYAGATSTVIGRNGAGGTSHDFTGRIDEARVYNRALTPSEIAVLARDLTMVDTDTVAVTVTAVNDAPTVSTTGSALGFTEGNAATAVDSGVVVADNDGGNLASATVSISAGFVAAQDQLLFANQNGISGSWNAATGVLTLSGSATVAQYQTALRSVQYLNISDTPSTAARTLSFTVNDGSAGSNTAQRTLNVTAVNDAPTFSSGSGLVTTDVLGNAGDFINAMVVQPDGKTLVAGYSSINGGDIVLARYDVDGSLDTSFGGGDGLVNLDQAGGYETSQALALLSDGRILVVGSVANDIVLAQFNADGSVDTSFGGGDGVATAGLSGAMGYGVKVQPDGKILVSGRYNNDMLVARFQGNGTLDTSFGSSGSTTVNFAGGVDIAYSMALQPDGGILLGGVAFTGVSFDAAVARLTSSGALDTSFNGTGRVSTDIGTNSSDTGYAMALQPDGKILLTGWSDAAGSTDFFTVRYNSDGTLDTGFSGDGKVTTGFGAGSDLGQAVAVQPDGKIVVAGQTANNGNNFGVVRYNADGTLDTTFNGSGSVETNFLGSSDDRAAAIAFQLDGRITIAGTSTLGGNHQLALARYTSTGALDTRFNVANTLGGTVAHTEGGAATVLDGNVVLFDAELDASTYSGATLTLQRNGGANAQDVFSATGTLAALNAGSNNLVVDGVTIGSVTTNSGGTLVLTFNGNATSALVTSAARQIAYSNSSDAPPASVQLDWTFDDGNTGAQGSGGALAASGSVTVNITATNDAPTITDGTALGLSDTDEDTASFPVAVSTLLSGAGWADADNGALQGLALTGVTGTGTWQYSTDGSTWTNVGSVSATQALLLDASSLLRYVPAGTNAETASFSFRAWDTTSGTASTFGSPSTANPGSGGGTSAFSSGSATASRNVTAVNDAPVLADTALTLTVAEDAGLPSGAVGSLVSAFTAGISDVDSGAAKGIAITATDESNGTWYYSTNGGTNWSPVGAVANTSALLLAHDGSTRLYFAPAANFNGTSAGALTLRGWDQTSGSAGTKVTTASNGGTTAFSSATDSVDATVTAVNDAPVNSLPGMQTTPVNTPLVLSGLSALSVADLDAGSLQVSLTATNGVITLASLTGLSFSSGDGSGDASMVFSGSIANLNAALDGLQFTPSNGYQGQASLAINTSDLGASGSGGSLQDSDTLVIQVGAARFQEGVAGYSGTQDTHLLGGSPNTAYGSATQVVADDNAAGEVALLKFDNLFGSGPGQIPWGSTITSASLSFYVTHTDNLDSVGLHQMLSAWSEATTYNSLGGGVQTNGTEAAMAAVATIDAGTAGWVTVTGLGSAVQAWALGGANHGWAFVSDNADAWAFASSEHATTAWRPYLTIAFSPPQGAVLGTSGGGAAFTENGTATAVDPGLTLSDADSTHLTGASVVISGGYQAGQDSLVFVDQAGITGSWNAGTGTLSLTGSATVAQYEAALRSITFSNSSESPNTAARTVSFTVSDAYADSNTAARSLAVAAVNDAPVLADTTLSITVAEDAGAPVGAVGSLISAFTGGMSDVDSGAANGIAITATDESNGTWYYSTDGGANWSPVGAVANTSALLLADDGSTRLYFAPAVNFNGTSAGALTLRGWDQTSGSAGTKVSTTSPGGTTAFSSATDTVDATVTAVNDAPVLATGSTLAYTENQAATAINTAITVADVDSSTLASATVQITGNYQSAEDVLAFTNAGMGNIAGAWNAGTGTLTLTSAGATATLAQWQAALRAVTYANSSDNPGTAARTVSFTVDDGSLASNTVTSTVNVTAVNDAPVNTVPGSISVTEDVATALTGISVADVDAGSAAMLVTLSVPSGTLAATSGGGVTVGGTASALTLTGSIADINAFIAASSITYTTAANANGSLTLTVLTSDQGSTGTGGALTDSDDVTLNITAANDAPTLGDGTLAAVDEDTASPAGQSVAVIFSGQFADIDSGSSFGGIAVVSNTANAGTQGVWQYSSNGGTNWFAIGTVGDDATALAISSSSLIRFLPVADYNGAPPALTVRGLDNSHAGGYSTTAGSESRVTVDTTTNGGTSAIASATATLSTSITAVNDAPVNTVPGSISVTEDVATALTGISVADGDAAAGTLLVTLSVPGGTLAATSGGGVTVGGTASALTLTGTAADINAFIAASSITYTTAGNANGAVTLTVLTSDQGSTGSGGALTDADAVTLNITATNDAPVLDNTGTMTLTSITEDDTGNAGQTVASIIASAGGDRITDADAGAAEGMAITATSNGNGSWAYSIDGGSSWSAVGAVTNNSALLLRATDRLRFVPNGNNATSGDVTFRAWDQTSGTEGTRVDVSSNGGTTAFSSATETATVSVTAVNDAPVLADTALALTVAEDAGLPSGAVGSLVSAFTGGVGDVDSGSARGIAITATDESNGSWYYSTNGGTSWNPVGAVSESSALLLADDGNTRLYFAPASNFTGHPAGALTLRAWDQTSGSAGTKVSTAGNGGSTAFSAATDSVDVTVTAVNDAPVITSNGGGATAAVSVAETRSAVTTVTSTDVDGGTPVYSLVASGDHAAFTIDSNTGALSFITPPDFEAPTDSDGDNIYQVTVQVSDGNGGIATQTLTVTVTDVSSTLVVTTTSDSNDSGLGTSFTAEQLNANPGADGAVSLREALIAANTMAGSQTISFNISGTGVHTISVTSALPAITSPVVIDATTDDSFAANGNRPAVVLDGNNAFAGDGLALAAGSGGSAIKGLEIRHFNGNGISVASGSSGNALFGNLIHSNTGLGIDLGGDGITANDGGDADSGANGLQNFPVLATANSTGGNTTITGSFNGSASTSFRIEFFSSPTGNASGHGEGPVFLGATTVTTDGSGNAQFAVVLAGVGVTAGHKVSATATVDLGGGNYGSTSEFAANVTATNTPAGITVSPINGNTTEASGSASFTVVLNTAPTADVTIAVSSSNPREGTVSTTLLTFTAANWNVPQTVTVTGADDSLADGNRAYTVVLAAASSADPAYNGLDPADVTVTNTDDDTQSTITVTTTSDTADGDTSSLVALLANPGADGQISLREALIAANNTANGSGGADRIHFNISGTGVHTLTPLTALPAISDAVILDGTTDDSFAANGNRPAIVLDGNDGAFDGLRLTASADGSTIKGLLVRDFGGSGIHVMAGSDNHRIEGNFIGALDSNGQFAAGEGLGGDGIYLAGSGTTVGGATAASRNVIAGAGASGIWIESATGNTVIGNYIGLAADGSTVIGNAWDGVTLANSANNRIGGTAAGEGNRIAGSGDDGIEVDAGSGSGNALLGNTITGSGSLGIDLGGNNDTPTPNDNGDADTGSNNLQNYPVLTGVGTNGSSQLAVSGTLNSTANSWFRIEFFSNTSSNGSGHGEGRTYLGFVNVATDGSGNASFSTLLSGVVVPAGAQVSATATVSNAAYNTFSETSEFALNVTAAYRAPDDLVVVPAVPRAGLLGFYAFSDPDLPGRNDASGGAPITLVGNPGQTAGPGGSGALDLAGGSSGQFGHIASLSTGGAMTLAASVRFDSTGSFQRVLDFGSANSGGIGAFYVSRLGTSNDLTFTIELGGSYTYRATAANVISNGSWLHFAATVDAGGRMALYVNGVQAASANGVVPTEGVRPNNFIGKSNWAADAAFDGAIDNLVIARGAMTAAQVAALYSQSTGFVVNENAATGTVLGTLVGLDPDASHTLSYSLSDNAGGRFAIDAATGTLTVANGALLDFETATSHSITVVVTNNDGLSTSKTFNISLVDRNDGPNNTVPGAQTTNEDTVKVFSTAAGNAIRITDADAGGANNQVTLSVTNGRLTLSGTAGLTFISGDGTADTTMTMRGTAAAINAALDGLVFTPTADTHGGAVLTLTTTDSVLLSLDIDTGLLGRYAFDNPGSLGQDSSPMAAHPAATVGVNSVTDGSRGAVAALDGSANSNLQVGGLMGAPSNVTLAAWVNLTSAGTSGSEVISLGDNLFLRVDGGVNRNELTAAAFMGGNWVSLVFHTPLAGTGWRHLAFSFDDTGNAATLYVDGEPVAQSVVTGSISYSRGSNTTIGTHGNGDPNFNFNGMLDEVRVYNRALTAHEVATLARDRAMASSSTVALTVAAVNDTPVVTTSGGTLSFTENGAAVFVDAGITLSDVDSATLEGATVSITANYDSAGGDRLQFVNQNGITGSWNASTGVLTLSGTATVAQYQAALRSVSFVTPSDAPAAGARTVSFAVNDGTDASTPATRTVAVTAVNDAPVLNTAAMSLNEGGTVTPTPANFGITDPDSASFIFTVSGVTGGYFQLTSALGTPVTTFTSADLAAGLVQFVDDGNEAAPAFSVTVNDGALNSNTLAATIGYTPVNDAPAINSASLTLNEGETVTLTPANLGITDPDSSSFTYTVSAVAGGYFQLSSAAGTPVTSFTSADLAAGLVQFVDDGNEAPPAYSVTVNDGAHASNRLQATVDYRAVNDDPVITLLDGKRLDYGEGDGLRALDVTADSRVQDVDSPNLAGGRLTATGRNGWQAGQDVLALRDQGMGTGQIGLQGSQVFFEGVAIGTWSGGSGGAALVVDFNLQATAAAATALLHSLGYENTDTASPVAGQRNVQVQLSDGAGGLSLVQNLTVQVAALDDAPKGLPLTLGTPAENQVLRADVSAVTDPDGLGPLSYQWLRNGIPISSATGSSYQLGPEDVGSDVQVRVSWVDGLGRAESLTSPSPGRVARALAAPQPTDASAAAPATEMRAKDPAPAAETATQPAASSSSTGPAAAAAPAEAAADAPLRIEGPAETAQTTNNATAEAGRTRLDAASRADASGSPLATMAERDWGLSTPLVSFEWVNALADGAGSPAIETAGRDLLRVQWRTSGIGSNATADNDWSRLALDGGKAEDGSALVRILQNPTPTASAGLTAGLLWWMTRSGGLLTSILMGVPAWRHIDLLPVLARPVNDPAEKKHGEGDETEETDAEPDAEAFEDSAIAMMFDESAAETAAGSRR